MLFSVRSSEVSLPKHDISHFYLIEDNWNDWWKYRTMYSLCFVNSQDKVQYIGSVKIGEYGMRSGKQKATQTNLPLEFEFLDNNRFFSIGQDVSYYESLNELGDDTRDQVLRSLNDMALLPDVYERARSENVVTESLMRDVRHTSVVGEYRRLSRGDARPTPYEFTYTGPNISGTKRIVLDFEVKPKSNPPTNLHILIGRNAVGKTHMINNMIDSLISSNPAYSRTGFFSAKSDEISSDGLFANVVSVSFSAFDPAEPLPERRNINEGVPYSYVGLKQINKPPKSPDNLKYDFAKSLYSISSSRKISRWLRAVQMLAADPIFDEANVPSILQTQADEEFSDGFPGNEEIIEDPSAREPDDGVLLKRRAQKFFHRLSSGHKIVLLTLTRLVETVEERTLVLLDEPEAHLHPPLLSAFVRALTDLLIQRNAVAIVATHSPVILQEVPRSCVWKLRRRGTQLSYMRTDIETFGENIGSLTSEIFELEVTLSGFYKILRDAVREFGDYDEIMEQFNDELGWEARAILRGLLSDNGGEDIS